MKHASLNEADIRQLPEIVEDSGAARTTLADAERRLRELALSVGEGTWLGREDVIMAKVGASRTTLRQIARMLEREGLLQVKKGATGGYFSTRPDRQFISSAVGSYLETLDLEFEDVVSVSIALWRDAVAKAADNAGSHSVEEIEKFKKLISEVPPDAAFADIRKFELEIGEMVLRLANSRYTQVLFAISVAFAKNRLPPPTIDTKDAQHFEFVERWRSTKLAELTAISQGDPELAAQASGSVHTLWTNEYLRTKKDER